MDPESYSLQPLPDGYTLLIPVPPQDDEALTIEEVEELQFLG